MRHRRPVCAVAIAVALIAAGCGSLRPAAEEPGQDAPDAAEEYERLRRLPGTDNINTIEKYREAGERAARLPRYSTSLGERAPHTIRTESLGPEESWEFLGPGNIGGRTRTLVIDPTDPAIMISGGVSGGLWKTTDGGGHWRAVGDELVNLAVNSLAMDPKNPRVLYAGTGEGYFREVIRGTALPLRGGGIFESSDGGDTWRQLPATFGDDFYFVNDLAISNLSSSRVYAATRTGVFRSDDAGEHWSRTLDPQVNGGCFDIAMRTDTTSDYLFVSCGTLAQASVYRNKNAERSDEWTAVLSDPGMGLTSLAIAPSNQNVIYALTAGNDGGPQGNLEQGLHAVFRSTRSGDSGSWDARLRNTDPSRLETYLLTNLTGALSSLCFNGQNNYTNMGWYANVIAVDPMNPDVVWAGGVDLFRSDDGAATWGLASYWWADSGTPSFVHADQHGVFFDPRYDGTTNRTMYATTDGGIFRTDNTAASLGYGRSAACDPARTTASWRTLNHNLGITQFYHGVVSFDGHRWIGGTQDNGTINGSTSSGADGWNRILGGDGGYSVIDPVDQSTIYAESQFANIAKSTDDGQNFRNATSGINENDFLFISPFLIDPNDHRRLWLGGGRLWRSTDSASSWVRASAKLAADEGLVSAIAAAPGVQGFVVFGTSTGAIFHMRSALGAGPLTTWPKVQPRNGFVSSLQFDPDRPDTIYATYAGFGGPHVYRSDDGASSWTSIDGVGESSLPDIPVHSIAVDSAHGRRLYLGTDLGIFVSLDEGKSWMVEQTGFLNVVTEWITLARGANGTALYAFTHGRGVWRVELDARSPRRRPVGR